MSGGSFGKLNNEQARNLIEHLENNLYQKASGICAYVQATYNISYTVAGMTWWLHHNGFSYKKPKEVPAKADEIKQLAFIEEYKKIKESALDNEPILFIDSVHPTMETKATCGWIKTGEDKQIQKRL